MLLLCAFLYCTKVLKVHRGSYTAHPLMKVKKPPFQGHTLRIDNFLNQKINYSLRI